MRPMRPESYRPARGTRGSRHHVIRCGDTGPATKTENWVWFFWKGAMLKRSKMDKGGAKLKNFMLKQFFKKQWGANAEIYHKLHLNHSTKFGENVKE